MYCAVSVFLSAPHALRAQLARRPRGGGIQIEHISLQSQSVEFAWDIKRYRVSAPARKLKRETSQKEGRKGGRREEGRRRPHVEISPDIDTLNMGDVPKDRNGKRRIEIRGGADSAF